MRCHPGKLCFCPVLLIILSLLFTVTSSPGAEISGTAPGKLPERCRIEAPARGECKALFTVYFFNRDTNRCEGSFYGGCGGTVPFDTEEECRQLCESEDTLKLSNLQPFDGFPSVLVDIEYPASWGDPGFSATVDGRAALSRTASTGSSEGARTKSLEVSVGGAGLRTVEISALINGEIKRVRAKRYLDMPEMVVLLDHAGDREAVFEQSPIRFFLFDAVDPRITINGKPVAIKKEPDAKGDIFAVTPQWKPGVNKVTIEATGRKGNLIKKEYSFVHLSEVKPSSRPSTQTNPVGPGYQFLAGSGLSVGERFTLQYGHEGSRSGPFYQVISTDGSVKVTGIKPPDTSFFSLDKDGWLINLTTRLWEVTGMHPGKAVLRFSVKRHFLGDVELEKEMELSVQN